MSIFKKSLMMLLASLAVLTPYIHASGAGDYYVAASSLGSGNGSSCANADSYTGAYIATAGNWIPGVTWHLCGTIVGQPGSTGVRVLGSGTNANPITIKFETGAVLTAPWWGNDPFNEGTAAAILCSGYSYVVVDGGGVGVIQNTANGSTELGYTNQQGTQGVGFSCAHSEIKGLIVRNLYVHYPGSRDASKGYDSPTTQCIGANGDFTLIHDNNVSGCAIGIGLGYGTVASGHNITSASLYNNTINTSCHMLNVGSGSEGASASGINIYGNTIGPDFNTWIMSTGGCHQNGMFIQTFLSGDKISGINIYNNDISASACTAPGGSFTGYLDFSTGSGSLSNANVFNNIFHATTNVNACQFTGMITAGDQTLPSSVSGLSIYNNTFDADSLTGGAGQNSAIVESGFVTGNNFRNNIFENFTSTNGLYYLSSDPNSMAAASTIIDYNLYYNVSKYLHDDNGSVDLASSAGWTAMGFDVHRFVGNPNLSSNYVPQPGSPALGLGANLTSLGITALDSDKNGNARLASGTWSTGAYQGGVNSPAPPSSLIATVN